MFSTLLGPLPRDPEADPASPADAIRDDLADLDAAGLELVSIGLPAGGVAPDVEAIVAAWRAVADQTRLPVKQVLAGPYSAGRRGPRANPQELAAALGPVIARLAAAGCPLIEIDESDALPIAADDRQRRRFVEAHRALFEAAGAAGVEFAAGAGSAADGLHLSLVLTGGNFDGAGAATFFDLPYASYAFDLIAGPENWRLITAAPTDRGIICGALGLEAGADETREVLVWAAHYAASSAGRGLARVGLANAPLRAGHEISRAEVLRKLAIVAEAGRIAAVESSEEIAGLLDPRSVGRRRAGAGISGVRGQAQAPERDPRP